MLEGMIVATLLIIFSASGVFLHRVYVRKLRVMQEARATGWSQALGGCSGSNPMEGVSQLVREGTPVRVLLERITGITTAGTANDVVVAPQQFGGVSIELESTVTVACNEKPASSNGDLFDLIGWAKDNFFASAYATPFF